MPRKSEPQRKDPFFLFMMVIFVIVGLFSVIERSRIVAVLVLAAIIGSYLLYRYQNEIFKG